LYQNTYLFAYYLVSISSLYRTATVFYKRTTTLYWCTYIKGSVYQRLVFIVRSYLRSF